MTFDRQNMARVASASTGAQANWLYRTDDTFIDILAPGYFDDAYTNLKVDDVIQIKDVAAYDYVSVISSDVSSVVVEQITFASTGPIEALFGQDFTSQEPVGLDNPLVLTFGADQGTPTDAIQLIGSVIHFNQDGVYGIRIFLSFTRTTVPGTTFLFLRGVLNGGQIGSPAAIIISDVDTTIPVELTFLGRFNEGDELTLELYKDSAGVDDGSLQPRTSGIGWGTAPSASIRVSKFT